MARKPKQGVEYFPHFVNSGKTIFMLESRFGNDGYAFWFKLLEIIGQQAGLFYDCNNQSNWIFLTSKCRVSDISATEILDMLASVDAIDRELWSKKIIWTQNLCDNVADVFKKRKTEIPSRPHFCDGNNTTTVEVDIQSTQSKVKESKVNKTISKKEPKPKEEKKKYGAYGHVLLTDDQLLQVKTKHPNNWEDILYFLDNKIEANGYKYKNFLAVVDGWAAESCVSSGYKAPKKLDTAPQSVKICPLCGAKKVGSMSQCVRCTEIHPDHFWDFDANEKVELN